MQAVTGCTKTTSGPVREKTVMDGLILAAGRGSRLGKLTEMAPKAMAYLPGGRFLLDDHIIRLRELNSSNIFILVGYLGDVIETYAKRHYPHCRLIRQDSELGTAADGLLAAEEHFLDDFVVVHGDHYFSEDPFPGLVTNHKHGSITFLLESPVNSRSLGYGERCLFRQSDGCVVQYPMEIQSTRDRPADPREMFLVDGCMVLPAGIFQAIRLARLADSQNLDVKEIFKHILLQSEIAMRGIEVPGWWANINDENAYFEVVSRLHTLGRKPQK